MFSRMEALLSALLFLSLALSSSQQGQIDLRLASAPPERGSSKSMVLECSPTDKTMTDHGVSWFRQPLTIEAPQFILHNSVRLKMGDQIDPKKFFTTKSNMNFRLEIKDFREEDQKTYHCLIIINSGLHFSNGVHLAYPTAPTSTTATTTTATIATRRSENCSCQISPPEVKPVIDSTLDFSCSLYIWAPLAAVSLLLLIAFLVTCSQLCKFCIRRKQCKHHAKKRPMNGNNGKPNRLV